MAAADPVKCGPRLKSRKWRNLPLTKLTRAERAMRFVEAYCRVPEGDKVGGMIVLAPFQERFFYDVYDNPHGTRRAYLTMARKNSKTATIATMLLVHLVGPEAKLNSHIQSGANSRKQAGEVYKYASKIVALSPELSGIVRTVPSSKTLIGLPMNVEYAAMSAEAKTAHGGSPILAILDETGQVRGPQSDFIDAIETSQGAYENPLLVVISTQAASDGDLFSIWLDDAERSQDPHIVSHVYAADKDAGLMDKQAWKDANPALGLFRSLKDVEEQCKGAARMPSRENTVRNLILNQRVEAVAPFVARSVWESNGGAPGDSTGKQVWGGLDLASVHDLTAFVAVDETGGVHPTFWLPKVGLVEKSRKDKVPYDLWEKQGYLQTTPGKAVEFEFVAKFLRTFFDNHDVQSIGFDRALMKFFTPWLVKAGFTDTELEKFVEYGQGLLSMTPALRELEVKLLNSQLRHGGHPVMNMCAANAKVVGDSGARKFDKKRARGRIDGMSALANAVGVMPIAGELETQGFVEL